MPEATVAHDLPRRQHQALIVLRYRAETMMISEEVVEFESQGATLRGLLLFGGHAAGPQPLVVMAHGTSATIQMVAIDYARCFAHAGLNVLLYDHRNFGASGGEPRCEINPWVQCRGYVDAISFAEKLPQVDANQIGIWGESFSGSHVVLVAACDRRVRCVVAQTPSLGATQPDLPPSQEVFERLQETLRHGDVRGGPDCTVGPLPVVSFDPESVPSLLHPIQAFRWFIDFGGRPGSRWVNRATRVLPKTPVPYSAYLCAPFLSAPTLFTVALDDEMPGANPRVARQVYELIPGNKQWNEISGGHFGLLYPDGVLFRQAADAATAFLRQHLF